MLLTFYSLSLSRLPTCVNKISKTYIILDLMLISYSLLSSRVVSSGSYEITVGVYKSELKILFLIIYMIIEVICYTIEPLLLRISQPHSMTLATLPKKSLENCKSVATN